MEMMNELLEKYFQGETSLAEEKELKQYFSKGNVSPEHEAYRGMFEEFSKELNETGNLPSIYTIIPKQRSMNRIWYQWLALTGIAAAVILLLWIQFPSSSDNYAIIGGNRIDNTEFAQRYTAKKLTKVNKLLARSLIPLQSLNNVREEIQPLRTLSEVKGKMEEIQYKLQLK
jgi:hypothetical protein